MKRLILQGIFHPQALPFKTSFKSPEQARFELVQHLFIGNDLMGKLSLEFSSLAVVLLIFYLNLLVKKVLENGGWQLKLPFKISSSTGGLSVTFFFQP